MIRPDAVGVATSLASASLLAIRFRRSCVDYDSGGRGCRGLQMAVAALLNVLLKAIRAVVDCMYTLIECADKSCCGVTGGAWEGIRQTMQNVGERRLALMALLALSKFSARTGLDC